MSARSFTTNGLVLKRSNVGETDRIVHLLTQEYGKLVCVAKGVRKLESTKRACLEPGNHIRGFFVATKSMPLLTQATLMSDCRTMELTLPKIRQLTQLLEILEALFVEQELEPEMFDAVLQLRERMVLNRASTVYVRDTLNEIITNLGFQHPEESAYPNISEYVAALSDKPMKSFEYLRVE